MLKKKSRLNELRDIIIDKRLYGKAFFFISVPMLMLGVILHLIIFWITNTLVIVVYVPLMILFVLLSGLFSKNAEIKIKNYSLKEYYSIGYSLSLIFMLTSVFAYSTQSTFFYLNDSIIGFVKLLLIMAIIDSALLISMFQITMLGQRISFRNSINLTDNFFKKQKKEWENKLEGFSNLDKILESLENENFIARLFDKGSFNLVVLWSCNTMEQIIDSAINELIPKMSEDIKILFRETDEKTKVEKGTRYPKQIKAIGYSNKFGKQDSKEQPDIEVLWGKIRNDIAHRNYKPTFKETYDALIILVLFIQEFPKKITDFTSKLEEKNN